MYTKEKRHWIYKMAKQVYDNGTRDSICSSLQHVMEVELEDVLPMSTPFLTKMETIFPEMNKIRPDNKSNMEYWWPKYERKPRLEAFDKLIKLTE